MHQYRIAPGSAAALAERDPADHGEWDKESGREETAHLVEGGERPFEAGVRGGGAR